MPNDIDLPIALFDSGVGGLTVFKAIRDTLPDENLLYLGDTARVPYGTKSHETIVRYTLMVAAKLADYGVKMLVIACNTATSAALSVLTEKFSPIPVIGVIEPGASAAVAASRNGHIAVLGTEATITENAYQKAIGRLKPDATVQGRACTLFVALAEEGWLTGTVPEGVAAHYLDDIFLSESDQIKPDTLLLGCTHFPLLEETLQKVVGNDVCIVDSAHATAEWVKKVLQSKNLARRHAGVASRRFLTTDNPERFSRTGSKFLGEIINPKDVELVDI